MRESEIYRILRTYNKEITKTVGANFQLFAQAIIDLSIYRETWDEIIFDKRRLVWFGILNIFSRRKAKVYFAKLYRDKKLKRLQDEAKELQEKLKAQKAKEAECSGQKINETKTDGSQEEIIVPNKTIVDANNRPLSSK